MIISIIKNKEEYLMPSNPSLSVTEPHNKNRDGDFAADNRFLLQTMPNISAIYKSAFNQNAAELRAAIALNPISRIQLIRGVVFTAAAKLASENNKSACEFLL